MLLVDEYVIGEDDRRGMKRETGEEEEYFW